MRAMVVVFFFSRASVLSVRMSSFVQGWRFTAARVAMQPCELRRARSIWLRCIHDSARITLCAPCADNCTRDEGKSRNKIPAGMIERGERKQTVEEVSKAV